MSPETDESANCYHDFGEILGVKRVFGDTVN